MKIVLSWYENIGIDICPDRKWSALEHADDVAISNQDQSLLQF